MPVLSSSQVTWLCDRHHEGFRFAAIARELGTTSQTVRRAVFGHSHREVERSGNLADDLLVWINARGGMLTLAEVYRDAPKYLRVDEARLSSLTAQGRLRWIKTPTETPDEMAYAVQTLLGPLPKPEESAR